MKKHNKVEVTVKVREGAALGTISYQKVFLDEKKMDKRGDKSIYVSADNHERLSRISKVIGEDRTPLYAYLDNILLHHFELFESMLINEFNKKSKPLF